MEREQGAQKRQMVTVESSEVRSVTYAVTIALEREARECRYVNWIERRKEEWRRSEEPLYNSEMTQLKS